MYSFNCLYYIFRYIIGCTSKEKSGGVIYGIFFCYLFWSAFEQAGASLTFFASNNTQRDLGFYVVPASFFQSLNSIFVVAFAPLVAWVWIKLGKANREPSSPLKMAIGLMLLALGYLWIATGVKGVGCLLYTSPSPRDRQKSRMPSSA